MPELQQKGLLRGQKINRYNTRDAADATSRVIFIFVNTVSKGRRPIKAFGAARHSTLFL